MEEEEVRATEYLLAKKIFGMSPYTAITILLILVVLLFIILFIVIHQLNIISRRYGALMSGKKGKDLEKVIFTRFKEMDKVKQNEYRLNREFKKIAKHQDLCISKYSLIKYDAFDDVSGKLSFVIALLNDSNSGIVLNSMHSRDGCYTYAKEIINGESYIPLSEEEKQAIAATKTVEEEIEDISEEDPFHVD